MLTATIKKAILLKKISAVLSNLFISISISIEDNKLHVLMVTSCKYMLFDITLELSDVVGETPVAFSVSSKFFLESFSTLKANDPVRLIIYEDKMTVEIISEGFKERGHLHINKTQTLSIENDPEYDSVIQAEGVNFQKLCKALITANKELLVRGNSRRITMRADFEEVYGKEIEFGDPFCAENVFEHVYSTENFLYISKISTLNNNLCFYVGPDKPFCIEAKFNEGIFKVFIKHKGMVEED